MKVKRLVDRTPRRLGLLTTEYTPINVPKGIPVDVYLRNESTNDFRVRLLSTGDDYYFILNEFGSTGYERELEGIILGEKRIQEVIEALTTGADGDILYYEIWLTEEV